VGHGVSDMVAGEERDVLRDLTLGPRSVPAMSPRWRTIPKRLRWTEQSQALATNLYSKRSRNANDIIKR
jgi:hypothetical protein